MKTIIPAFSRRPGSVLFGAVLFFALTCQAQPGPGQGAAGKNASDGVYTAAQAAHGQSLFGENCMVCHGGDLEGGDGYPALVGTSFLKKWGGLSVGTLHNFIDTNMPPGNGGMLGAASEADVVAYILSKNGFPAGANSLPPDPGGLSAITIDKPAGGN